MNAEANPVPDQQEKALLTYVERLGKTAKGRHALHFKFSDLRPKNRQPKRLHIAALALEPFIGVHEGNLFRMHNEDFMVLCKDASIEAISEAAAHVTALFEDDPAAQSAGGGEGGFWQHYDFTKNYSELVTVLRKLSAAAQLSAEGNGADGPQAGPDAEQRSLSPSLLGKIQSAIAQADLSNVIRRQQVCAIVPGMPPEPVFTEVFTSMTILRDAVSPDIDLAANTWLFHDLTSHLDRRMISYLSHKDDSTLEKAISINLNVESLASQEFLSFDQTLTSDTRATVVIELQLIDVMSDLDTFYFSRNHLRDRKYRFCLDGMNFKTLPIVDCARLGVDLVKLIWNRELHALAKAKDPDLMAAVKAIDPKRIILIRCDDKLAFETGKLLGSSLYQGFLIDDMLKQAPQKPAARSSAA